MKINSINDIITYLLSFFIPEIKKDWQIKSIIENKLNNDFNNDNVFINKNVILLSERK
jgi:hypothetical protein